LSVCARLPAFGLSVSTSVRAGGYRAIYEVDPDTGQNRTAGDVVVLRVYGPGQHRRTL